MKKTLLILLISCISIASAFYFEYVLHLYPCNLCLAQRFSHYLIIATSILTLISIKLSRTYLVVVTKIMLLLSIVSGLIFSGRQIYLQRFAASDSINCGIDLVTMFENFAPITALKKLFEGTLDCATVDWSLFGLSIADYSFLLFLSMLVVQLFNFKLSKK